MSTAAVAMFFSLLGVAIPIWIWNLNDIFDWKARLYIKRLIKREQR